MTTLRPVGRERRGVETGAFTRDCRTRAGTPLRHAAACGTERAVRLLLEAGAGKESRDANGDTPLAWASWHLRPAPVLRMPGCDGFTIHTENCSTCDHAAGRGQMDPPSRGKPHT